MKLLSLAAKWRRWNKLIGDKFPTLIYVNAITLQASGTGGALEDNKYRFRD